VKSARFSLGPVPNSNKVLYSTSCTWYSRLVVGSSRVRCRIRIICHVMIDGRFTGGSGLY